MENLKKMQQRRDAPSLTTVTPTLSGLRCEHEDLDTVLIPWRNIRITHSKYLLFESEHRKLLADFPINSIKLNGMRNVETFFRLKRRACIQSYKKEGFTWTCVSEWKRSSPLIVFGLLAFAFGAFIIVSATFHDWDDAFAGLNATQREYYTTVAYFCCYGMTATFLGMGLACYLATRNHRSNYFAADRIEKVVLRDSTLCFQFHSERSIKIKLSEISEITRSGFVRARNPQARRLAFRPAQILEWARFASSFQKELDDRKKKEKENRLNWTRVFRVVFWCTLFGAICMAVDILATVTEQHWLRFTTPVLAAGLLQTIGFDDYFFDYVFYAAKVKLGFQPRRSPRPFVVAQLKAAK